MPAASDDRWMSTSEASQYLGYKKLTAFYQAIHRGSVPAHRYGPRQLRFRKSELDALMVKGGPAKVPTPINLHRAKKAG